MPPGSWNGASAATQTSGGEQTAWVSERTRQGMASSTESPPDVTVANGERPGPLWARWRGRAPRPVVDALVAVATTVVAVALLAISEEPDRHVPDAVGYALLVLAGAPLAARRRWPATALAVTAATALGYFVLAYPGGPVTVPVLVALYGAAAEGRRVPALVVVGFFVGVGSAHRLVVQAEPFTVVAFQGLLYVFAWLLGELVSSRRALRAEVSARLRRAAEEREREAERRVQHERVRIARELHDVLAHTVSSMTVQAGVADDLLDDRPDEARTALRAMRRAGREAMGELRATVSLLRGGDDGTPLPPAPGLADLDALIEPVNRDGLTVKRVTVGEPRPLPAAVELTAYRIVQEALTNVVRHSRADTAVVQLVKDGHVLLLSIKDDGVGFDVPSLRKRAPRAATLGLISMQERAHAAGGTIEIDSVISKGTAVRFRLNLEPR